MATKKLRAGRFVDRDDDPRTAKPAQSGETATLVGFLRWQRETLELKCSGLDAEQLARRAVEPSTVSLLGLVRVLVHMIEEYARHLGHADLLRERIDGRVGM